MSSENDRLESAIVRYRGPARTDPGEDLVQLFSFEGVGFSLWLEATFDWVGADYKAVIMNFGIADRVSALSRDPRLQTPFQSQEVETAKRKIRNYFSGPGGEQMAFGRGRCLDVMFPVGWVREVDP